MPPKQHHCVLYHTVALSQQLLHRAAYMYGPRVPGPRGKDAVSIEASLRLVALEPIFRPAAFPGGASDPGSGSCFSYGSNSLEITFFPGAKR